MKFGPIEGNSEEIKNFFQDNGLKVADYIALPEVPIKRAWFAISAGVSICAAAVLIFLDPITRAAATFTFLVGCGGGLWLSVIAQLRFKSPWATGLVAIGCLLLMLVAVGAVTPLEMLEEVKSLRK